MQRLGFDRLKLFDSVMEGLKNRPENRADRRHEVVRFHLFSLAALVWVCSSLQCLAQASAGYLATSVPMVLRFSAQVLPITPEQKKIMVATASVPSPIYPLARTPNDGASKLRMGTTLPSENAITPKMLVRFFEKATSSNRTVDGSVQFRPPIKGAVESIKENPLK